MSTKKDLTLQEKSNKDPSQNDKYTQTRVMETKYIQNEKTQTREISIQTNTEDLGSSQAICEEVAEQPLSEKSDKCLHSEDNLKLVTPKDKNLQLTSPSQNDKYTQTLVIQTKEKSTQTNVEDLEISQAICKEETEHPISEKSDEAKCFHREDNLKLLSPGDKDPQLTSLTESPMQVTQPSSQSNTKKTCVKAKIKGTSNTKVNTSEIEILGQVNPQESLINAPRSYAKVLSEKETTEYPVLVESEENFPPLEDKNLQPRFQTDSSMQVTLQQPSSQSSSRKSSIKAKFKMKLNKKSNSSEMENLEQVKPQERLEDLTKDNSKVISEDETTEYPVLVESEEKLLRKHLQPRLQSNSSMQVTLQQPSSNSNSKKSSVKEKFKMKSNKKANASEIEILEQVKPQSSLKDATKSYASIVSKKETTEYPVLVESDEKFPFPKWKPAPLEDKNLQPRLQTDSSMQVALQQPSSQSSSRKSSIKAEFKMKSNKKNTTSEMDNLGQVKPQGSLKDATECYTKVISEEETTKYPLLVESKEKFLSKNKWELAPHEDKNLQPRLQTDSSMQVTQKQPSSQSSSKNSSVKAVIKTQSPQIKMESKKETTIPEVEILGPRLQTDSSSKQVSQPLCQASSKKSKIKARSHKINMKSKKEATTSGMEILGEVKPQGNIKNTTKSSSKALNEETEHPMGSEEKFPKIDKLQLAPSRDKEDLQTAIKTDSLVHVEHQQSSSQSKSSSKGFSEEIAHSVSEDKFKLDSPVDKDLQLGLQTDSSSKQVTQPPSKSSLKKSSVKENILPQSHQIKIESKKETTTSEMKILGEVKLQERVKGETKSFSNAVMEEETEHPVSVGSEKKSLIEGKLKQDIIESKELQLTLQTDSSMQITQPPNPSRSNSKKSSINAKIKPQSPQIKMESKKEDTTKSSSKALNKEMELPISVGSEEKFPREDKLQLTPSDKKGLQAAIKTDSSVEVAQQHSSSQSSSKKSVRPKKKSQRKEDTTLEIKVPEEQKTSEGLKDTTKISSKESSESRSLSKESITTQTLKNLYRELENRKIEIEKSRESCESKTGSISKQGSKESSATEETVSAEDLEYIEAITSEGRKLKDAAELLFARQYDSFDYVKRNRLCQQILDSDPLIGIIESQNYFKKLYDNFCNKIRELNQIDNIVSEFSAINNDYERIKYVLQFAEVINMKVVIHPSKSQLYALALENEFDKCIIESSKGDTKDCFKRALQLISRSIQFTEGRHSINIAQRLMKRAWLHILLQEYEDARMDGHRSLLYHDELTLMWNAYEILGHCYAHRMDNIASENYFIQAIEGLRQSDNDNHIKATSIGRITKIYKIVKGRRITKRHKDDDSSKLTNPRISYGINGILKCATDAVEVKVKEESGRGLYAKKDIKPGDVIIVEEPYVSALNRECFETHCNSCYKRSKSFLPCDNCSRVWFCSEECLKESQTGFHSSECDVLHLLYDESIGSMGIIVFRILLKLTWKNIKLLRKSKKINTQLPDSHPLNTEFNWEEKYNTEDYLNTYKLVTNSHKRSFGDLFKRSVCAVYIQQCLKVVNFFKGEDVSLDDEIFVASLILRHLQNSSCNAYGITEFIVGESYLEDVNILEVAGSIYPTISLINHSCSPNVFRYSIGKDCIVRATKIIKKGEQLFDSYGSLFDEVGREDRRKILTNQYKFECNCTACQEDWPVYEKNKVYVKLACPEEYCDQIAEYDGFREMKCPFCGVTSKHKILLTETKARIKNLKDAMGKLRKGVTDKTADAFKHFQMYADKYIIPPSRCLTDCQESFKRYILSEGNLHNKIKT